jgi:hypothetical protein
VSLDRARQRKQVSKQETHSVLLTEPNKSAQHNPDWQSACNATPNARTHGSTRFPRPGHPSPVRPFFRAYVSRASPAPSPIDCAKFHYVCSAGAIVVELTPLVLAAARLAAREPIRGNYGGGGGGRMGLGVGGGGCANKRGGRSLLGSAIT